MTYLITYDIADPKRLRRICRILEAYGTRVQYSVFECPIETRTLLQLWGILTQRISLKEDRLCAYPLDVRACEHTLRAGNMQEAARPGELVIIA